MTYKQQMGALMKWCSENGVNYNGASVAYEVQLHLEIYAPNLKPSDEEFEELCAIVEHIWTKEPYDEVALPRIARVVLDEYMVAQCDVDEMDERHILNALLLR